MKFIELTVEADPPQKYLINPQQISFIVAHTGGGCILQYGAAYNDYIRVTENYDDIKAVLAAKESDHE